MKLACVATALVTLAPGFTTAQSPAAADPEMAVAAVIGESFASGPIAFDTRFGGLSAARLRSRERTSAIARLLHADARRGDSVVVCTARSPSSCSLGSYAVLVSMSRPVFARDRHSAVVTVTTMRMTGLSRVPIGAQDVDYTVARRGGLWRVVHRRVTRVT